MNQASIAVECARGITPPGASVQSWGTSVGDPEGGRPGPGFGGGAGNGSPRGVSRTYADSEVRLGPAPGCDGGRDAALGRLPGYRPDGENAAARAPGSSRVERLLTSYRVRALLRRHATSPRIAKCGRVVHEDPTVVTELLANGERQARWTGVVTCQRTGCPVCEAAKARKLGRAVRRMLGSGGVWQHVALTVPHETGEAWGTVYQRLLDGIRGLSHGRVGRVLRPLALATLRATETTWSHRSGWHVHAHVMWGLARPLTAEEREIIAFAWAGLTEASVEHGVHFGRTYHAAIAGDAGTYLEKLALEIAGAGKTAHGEHWSLGDLYQRAARGERPDLIQHYQRETRGKRLYQLDKRAKRLHDAAPELPDQVVVETWVTPIERHHFAALSRAEYGDPIAIYLPLEVAIQCQGDPSIDVEDQVFELIRAGPSPPETA